MSILKHIACISLLAFSCLPFLSQASEPHSEHNKTMQPMANETPAETNEEANGKPWSMADQYYGAENMAKARKALQISAGGANIYLVMLDRLETQITNGDNALIWDAQAWYGTDENKLWIKTEGEYGFGSDEVEDAEIQVLWSKPVSAFWDVQAGLRYDLEPKGRSHAVLGFQGLAPYWFEIDAALFLSHKGDLTSRIETEYDFILSQRLLLQPRAEIEISAQDIPKLGVGSGFGNLDLGLRLRYEIKREFAPYIGIEWQKNLGKTSQFTRATGGDPDNISLLIGIKAWH